VTHSLPTTVLPKRYRKTKISSVPLPQIASLKTTISVCLSVKTNELRTRNTALCRTVLSMRLVIAAV